ncbi:polysaccharide lyase [Desulfococcus multivorans]|uniref:Polysaccharide lyase n=1 Tax=Desulfococcus multivorans DSM 2059 TaxID=1121405 RepID=S7UPP7_DESML|nr:polysaccharide lyase [Desulfococcus multivorans]AOY60013.1 conserved uncharacterized protein, DUF1080 [Desulfococcus multivorans]AQV02155.1 hypothetical protein B2D07_16230 [Desulfococcus multivorans]EPR36009.1 Polysaccharide lyase [Desulfococcus multivorans DSM 2059]SJZ36736.1 Concanavalin A-like lectin/glucanases superfamily protein [Desulfococcus multivorans DSM 2059]
MKKYFCITVMLLWLCAAPAQSAVLFYDDCENEWSLTDWYPKPYTNIIEVSPEKARAGSSSYKFTQKPYPTSNSHVELLLNARNSPIYIQNFPYNKEFWIGYSLYLPADFETPYRPSNHGATMQFHSAGDACDNSVSNGPTGTFFYTPTQGQWRIYTQGVSAKCTNTSKDRVHSSYATYTPGKWHDIVIHFKFDYRADNNPFFKVWVDGVLVKDDYGINCWNDAKGPRFHIGIYSQTSSGLTVYYDEIRIGDSNSSYAEVAPKGSAPAPVEPSFMEPPNTLRLKGASSSQ